MTGFEKSYSNSARQTSPAATVSCGAASAWAPRDVEERGPASGHIVIQPSIERDVSNRAVPFTVDSPCSYSSSAAEPDGHRGPLAKQVRPERTRGSCAVRVTLVGAAVSGVESSAA